MSEPVRVKIRMKDGGVFNVTSPEPHELFRWIARGKSRSFFSPGPRALYFEDGAVVDIDEIQVAWIDK